MDPDMPHMVCWETAAKKIWAWEFVHWTEAEAQKNQGHQAKK
jgi:hypothetical protein